MRTLTLTASALTLLACAATRKESPVAPPSTPEASGNPLLSSWSGPYGGVPPFDRIRVEHFRPAIEAGMAEHKKELEAIATSPEPATFENTTVEFERAGKRLGRVRNLYSVYSAALSSPELQALERELAPMLAAFSDSIYQDEALFRRIDAVHQVQAALDLTPEQRRLSWLQHRDFVRAGARLGPKAKARLTEINQRLATLFTAFNQNVLADEERHAVIVESEEELQGLPASIRAGAKAAASARGLEGKFAIVNTRSFMEPVLTFAANRSLRERVFRLYTQRGDNGDAHDNNALISEILALRAERAKLLGLATHAHWRLEDAMAKSPERAAELMEAVWPAAVARVREEVQDMGPLAAEEGIGGGLQPWDYRYFAEKVRKAKYDLDEGEVKPYLQLEALREAMFWVAGELFDLRFRPAPEVPVYHPDVRVWAVEEGASGRLAGLFYFDPYARPGKRSGAWMSSYRRQERVDGEVPTLVSNNSNFVKPPPGEPVLIGWQDAETLFHEFGHALHGLCSQVTYPSLSGTAVPRDFVEFPSQLLEHWLPTPEVLGRFARHYQTGEPMPKALVEKLQRAATFNQGFATVEYLSSAWVDLKLHLAAEHPIDPRAFEAQTLRALGMPKEIVMRHRLPHFSHLFSGDAYSAGYYSYLWADTLTTDAFEAFLEAGGPYDRQMASRLRTHVFSAGNTRDPAESYRAFRGRDPGIDALMRKRGFPVPASRPNR
jgi:peptidyl-dipeptidase Dcp